MKIKMNTLYAGPAGVMEAGSTNDVDNALGTELVAAGYAVDVTPRAAPVPAPEPAPVLEPVIETAALTVDALEKAVKPRAKKKS